MKRQVIDILKEYMRVRNEFDAKVYAAFPAWRTEYLDQLSQEAHEAYYDYAKSIMMDGTEQSNRLLYYITTMRFILYLSQDFIEATEHPFRCRCSQCLQWWAEMGPDEDEPHYGPFSESEVLEYISRATRDNPS